MPDNISPMYGNFSLTGAGAGAIFATRWGAWDTLEFVNPKGIFAKTRLSL